MANNEKLHELNVEKEVSGMIAQASFDSKPESGQRRQELFQMNLAIYITSFINKSLSLARSQGAAEAIKPKDERILALQECLGDLRDFKDYVHKRLDEAGIATHPDGEHSKHGCRIGDRLDIVLNAKVSIPQCLEECKLNADELNAVYKEAEDSGIFRGKIMHLTQEKVFEKFAALLSSVEGLPTKAEAEVRLESLGLILANESVFQYVESIIDTASLLLLAKDEENKKEILEFAHWCYVNPDLTMSLSHWRYKGEKISASDLYEIFRLREAKDMGGEND